MKIDFRHLAILVPLFAACGNDDNGNEPVKPTTPPPANLTAEARTATVQGGAPSYFRFRDGAVLNESQAADGSWDLKFSGWQILTNGGVSGEGMAGGVPYANLTFEEIADKDIPPHVFSDEYGSVFTDWYVEDMSSERHFLNSTKHVYLIQTAPERIYKMQILSYYGDVRGTPVSAMYKIQYQPIDGSEPVTTVDNIDGTTGGIHAGGDAGYFSFEKGRLTLTDEQAKASAEWDLRFRRATIEPNGGRFGPGQVKAFDTKQTDLARVTAAQMPPPPAFVDSALQPVVKDWYVYGRDHSLTLNKTAYVLRAADGKSWYKFQPTSLNGGGREGFGSLEFRYQAIRLP